MFKDIYSESDSTEIVLNFHGKADKDTLHWRYVMKCTLHNNSVNKHMIFFHLLKFSVNETTFAPASVVDLLVHRDR